MRFYTVTMSSVFLRDTKQYGIGALELLEGRFDRVLPLKRTALISTE